MLKAKRRDAMASYKWLSLLILPLKFSCSCPLQNWRKKLYILCLCRCRKRWGHELISSIDLSTFLSILLSLQTHICDSPLQVVLQNTNWSRLDEFRFEGSEPPGSIAGTDLGIEYIWSRESRLGHGSDEFR